VADAKVRCESAGKFDRLAWRRSYRVKYCVPSSGDGGEPGLAVGWISGVRAALTCVKGKSVRV
jgi:hypothetical protein